MAKMKMDKEDRAEKKAGKKMSGPGFMKEEMAELSKGKKGMSKVSPRDPAPKPMKKK